MALHEGTRIEDGNVVDLNLGSYTPLRMVDVPDIEVAFVESTEAPVGLGEPGTTVIAPAVANAIFNATGARVRHLPITADAVLAALES
jgi:CO/xanthine dehydrogenase Mo-binding subunit